MSGADLPAIDGGELPAIGGGDLPVIGGGDLLVIGGGDLAGGFNIINLPVNSAIRFDGNFGSFAFKTIAEATIRFRDTESEIRIKTSDDDIWIQWDSEDIMVLGQEAD